MLPHKQSNLSAPTLIGLRRAKEHVKNEGGAHKMTIDKEMLQDLKSSHQKYEQSLKEEAEEKIRNERKERQKKEELERKT